MTTRSGNPTVNVSISSTTGGSLPTTWEHPISWDSLEKYFKPALNKDTRKVFNMLLENSKSLEDHLDSAYLKISGGAVAGATTFSGNINLSGSLVLNGVSITPYSFPPTGSIMPYAGSAAPGGWLLCDGTPYSTTTYAALYAVCGSTYNTSAGQLSPVVGSFRVPILKGRMPVGLDASVTDFNTRGKSGGSTTVTITIAQMPGHHHTQPAHNHVQDVHSHTYSGTVVTGGAHTPTGTVVTDGAHTPTGGVNDGAGSHSHLIATDTTANTGHAHTLAGGGAEIMAGSGSASNGTGTYTVGIDGIHDHDITIAAVAGHGHGITIDPVAGHGHTFSGTTVAIPAVLNAQQPATDTLDTGSGNAVDNMSPYLVLNYIIKT